MTFHQSCPPHIAWSACRVFASLLLLSVTERLAAAPPTRTPSPVTAAQVTPTPTPKLKIDKHPYLVAVGPEEISIRPLAGPRVRRPPLLPRPSTPEPEPEAARKNSAPTPPPRPPVEPSTLSPDAPPVLLPAEKGPATPAPEKKEAPAESVLAPAARAEEELKDAVIYFETPVGPHGAQVTIPATVPLNAPPAVALPRSKATYRKEKE